MPSPQVLAAAHAQVGGLGAQAPTGPPFGMRLLPGEGAGVLCGDQAHGEGSLKADSDPVSGSQEPAAPDPRAGHCVGRRAPRESHVAGPTWQGRWAVASPRGGG